MSPIILQRSDILEEAPPTTPWTTSALLAIGVASTVLLIALGIGIFLYRRRRSFQLGHRERASISQIAWSPVTTLNSTPFASHNNSPTRPCPWDKSGYSASYGSRVGSFYTATTDTAPGSPCAFLGSKSTMKVQLEVGCAEEGKEPVEVQDSDGAQELWGCKRSISPLDLSPYLARLPSVKAGATNRVSDIIRGSTLLGGTDWEGRRNARRETMMSGITLSDVTADASIQPPTIKAGISALDRRSALFSPNELQSLFQERNAGAPVPNMPDAKGA